MSEELKKDLQTRLKEFRELRKSKLVEKIEDEPFLSSWDYVYYLTKYKSKNEISPNQ
jgi:hypothetical protein